MRIGVPFFRFGEWAAGTYNERLQNSLRDMHATRWFKAIIANWVRFGFQEGFQLSLLQESVVLLAYSLQIPRVTDLNAFNTDVFTGFKTFFQRHS